MASKIYIQLPPSRVTLAGHDYDDVDEDFITAHGMLIAPDHIRGVVMRCVIERDDGRVLNIIDAMKWGEQVCVVGRAMLKGALQVLKAFDCRDHRVAAAIHQSHTCSSSCISFQTCLHR